MQVVPHQRPLRICKVHVAPQLQCLLSANPFTHLLYLALPAFLETFNTLYDIWLQAKECDVHVMSHERCLANLSGMPRVHPLGGRWLGSRDSSAAFAKYNSNASDHRVSTQIEVLESTTPV